jgi:uncharacterized protein (TIGR03086 family)
MDKFEYLDRAGAEFRARLDRVRADQWSLPTPCAEWDVRALVNHVVTANLTGERLLHGASREDTVALIGTDLVGDDPPAAFERSVAAQAAAFREPGALDQIVHHPAFDMPATQLLEFRIGDLLIHAWDLARAIGADETLDPEVVDAVWESLAPLASALPASGAFGAGASSALGEPASRQLHLLDLSGRRPNQAQIRGPES